MTGAEHHFPNGLAIIAAAAKNAGHEVDIIDLEVCRLESGGSLNLITKLKTFKPDIVGIGGLVAACCQQAIITNIIRNQYKTKIVVGGQGFTSCPEFYMNYLDIDFGIEHDGCQSFPELLNALENNTKFDHIKGLYYRNGTEIIYTGKRELEKDLDSMPLPIYDIFNLDYYIYSSQRQYKNTLDILGSVGCPFNCNFCMSGCNDSRVRYHSVEYMEDWIDMAVNRLGVKRIYFDDDSLIPSKWLDKLCEVLDKYNLTWICNTPARAVKSNTVDMMKETGCITLNIGTESLSEKILKNMDKGINVKNSIKAIETVCDTGITLSTGLMYGYRGECYDTINESMQNITDLNARQCALDSLMFYTTPYPSTCLFDECRELIIDKFGSIEDYLFSLPPHATIFCINVSDMSNFEYFYYRSMLQSALWIDRPHRKSIYS